MAPDLEEGALIPTSEPMTDDAYIDTQNTLALLADLAAPLDLEGFLRRAHRADTLGAILDPTLYREAAPPLAAVIRLAEAGLAFQRAGAEALAVARGR